MYIDFCITLPSREGINWQTGCLEHRGLFSKGRNKNIVSAQKIDQSQVNFKSKDFLLNSFLKLSFFLFLF
jgi:hypothetical protein